MLLQIFLRLVKLDIRLAAVLCLMMSIELQLPFLIQCMEAIRVKVGSCWKIFQRNYIYYVGKMFFVEIDRLLPSLKKSNLIKPRSRYHLVASKLAS